MTASAGISSVTAVGAIGSGNFSLVAVTGGCQRLGVSIATGATGVGLDAGGLTTGSGGDLSAVAVTQGLTLGSATDRAGLGSIAGSIAPLMTQGLALGSTTDRAGLGSIAGSIAPLVTQGLALGSTTDRAGLGSIAGSRLPAMTCNFAFGSATDRAGLGSKTSSICPLMVAGILNAQLIGVQVEAENISTGSLGGNFTVCRYIRAERQTFYTISDRSRAAAPFVTCIITHDLELIGLISLQRHGNITYSCVFGIQSEFRFLRFPDIKVATQVSIRTQGINGSHPFGSLKIIILTVLNGQIPGLISVTVIKDDITIALFKSILVNIKAIYLVACFVHLSTMPGSIKDIPLKCIRIYSCPLAGIDAIDRNSSRRCTSTPGAGTAIPCAIGNGKQVFTIGRDGQVAGLVPLVVPVVGSVAGVHAAENHIGPIAGRNIYLIQSVDGSRHADPCVLTGALKEIGRKAGVGLSPVVVGLQVQRFCSSSLGLHRDHRQKRQHHAQAQHQTQQPMDRFTASYHYISLHIRVLVTLTIA